MATDKKQVKVTAKLFDGIPQCCSGRARYQFKVTIEADRKGYPVDFWQGMIREFDSESFLACITNDCIAVMEYGRDIRSICENYLISEGGFAEESKTIQLALRMRDNYDRIKRAFYNEEDFKDWVFAEFERIND